MATFKQLTTRSAGQEQLKEEWNNLVADKVKAKEALRKAKREVPQDPEKIESAKADVAKANDALNMQREKEKEFNNTEKARIKGGGETKQDTLDRPTNPDASQAENIANTSRTSGSQSDSSSSQSSGQGNNSSSQSSEQGNNSSSQSNGQSEQNSSDGSKNDSKSSGKGMPLSQSFYDSVAGAIKVGKNGNALDSASKTAKEQAQNYRNRSATNQMEAQRAQQNADMNPYSEAGKIASMQNDSVNRQNISGQSLNAGTGAGRLRAGTTPDIQTQKEFAVRQQDVANQRRDEANTAQEENTAAEGDAETFHFKSRDLNDDRAESSNLSMGSPDFGSKEEQKTEDNTQQEEEQKTEDNTQQEEEQKPDEKEEEEKEPEDTPESSGTTWQNLMNYLTYGNDSTSGWGKGTKPGYQEAKAYAEANGWSPIQASQSEYDGNIGHLQELVKAQQPGFYEAWQNGSGRVGEGGAQINRGDKGDEVIDSKKTSDGVSDARLKNIMTCLSDLRMKSILSSYENNGCCSPEDFMWLAAHTGGKFCHNGNDYNFFNDDDWNGEDNDSVLSGYADYIRNYVYTYKPEAVKVDSRIDPNEEHIGPMAQDIEKVNPACIKETPEGVKTVDTARLAMMNAGAIGDLARQMQDLVDKLKMIGVE